MGNISSLDSSRELIYKNLDRIIATAQVASDEALLYKSDTSNLSEHNKQYTALLRAYVEDFEENSRKKRANKQSLFVIAKFLLICVPVLTFLFIFITLVCLVCGSIDVFESIPGLITALTTLLGTFMIIPQMITKYLYNKKEEENLKEIIGKIQDYDKNIRGVLK